MSGRNSLPPGLRGCCGAPASRLSPAMRPRMHRACTVRVPKPCPSMRNPNRQVATEVLLRLQSDMQRPRRQRAAPAAPPLPPGQRCAPGARLAASRSRERMREAQTEGQIKGAARRHPKSQSARGVGAAQHLLVPVLLQCAIPRRLGVARVPLPILCAPMRWSVRHGQA